MSKTTPHSTDAMNTASEQKEAPQSPEMTSGFLYDFIFVLVFVVFLVLCFVGVKYNEIQNKLDSKATAEERDNMVNTKICSSSTEVCAVQTEIFRKRMREFALKEDVTPNQMKARMEALKAESLDAALKKLSASAS